MNYKLGCLLGQLVGDALGTRYEFLRREDVLEKLKEDENNNFLPILGGGKFKAGKGQFTDDSELAMGLLCSIIENKRYEKEKVAEKYSKWFLSNPFDIGRTTSNAFFRAYSYNDMVENSILNNANSLSNGCLMRISPLGVYGVDNNEKYLKNIVKVECKITHPNVKAIDACQVFVFAIREAIKTRGDKIKVLQKAKEVAETDFVKIILEKSLEKDLQFFFDGKEVKTDGHQQGFLGIALLNAFYQLNNTNDFYNGMINTIKLGGDVDTNCCICGALLGAVYGEEGIPEEWVKTLINAEIKYDRLEKYPEIDVKNIWKFLERSG